MTYTHNIPGGIAFLGLAVMVTGAALLLWYESAALLSGLLPPLTWMVDKAEHRHFVAVTAIVGALLFFVGLLLGHFFWPNTPAADWLRTLVGKS